MKNSLSFCTCRWS